MKTFVTKVCNYTELHDVVKGLNSSHPVLREVRPYMFWGALTYALMSKEGALSIIQTKIGKRKKNAFEPYANWYLSFTRPDQRRQGHATTLYRLVEKLAVDAGCRRVKSLAGTAAGLGLHLSLGHECWGLTESNEVFVDSPLPGAAVHYTPDMRPGQAPGPRMSESEIRAQIQKGLRYDVA